MNILSVIGTRPQYIKVKAIYDYCRQQQINHYILDTQQHYSDNVSASIIRDLNLTIDYALTLQPGKEIDFVSDCIREMKKVFEKLMPDIILVYGDTNSTLCAALTAYKMNIPVAHIEAGERCFDLSVPEEVTRKFVDDIATYNFCSSTKALTNLEDGILCGDLEYEVLNNMDPDISYEPFGVMTIHRQSNCSAERIKKILSFCEKTKTEIKFFVHHRIKPLLPSAIPSNVTLLDSCPYSEMVDNLARCAWVITDSGGLQKTSAFFGKRTLVKRDNTEWKEVEDRNYARLSNFSKEDIRWLKEGTTERRKYFYLTYRMPSDIIFSTIMNKEEENE